MPGRVLRLLMVAAGVLFVAARPAPVRPTIALIADAGLADPASYGIARLREALRSRGFRILDAPTAQQADAVIIAGLRSGAAGKTLASWGGVVPDAAEALAVRKGTYRNKPAVVICGADARGLMYAAIDTAERLSWRSSRKDPFESIHDTVEKPFLAERGVSMYTMQRAYFESRLYDERYWTRYFDMLAADRINSFVVIFGYENGGFLAPPYPYFFDVEQFPDVQFVGLSHADQARNTAAFKTLIRIAHQRGISVTAGIWDHIYRGGVQAGGIPGAPKNAAVRTPGLVWGVTGDNLAAYTKAAIRKFLQVFPDIDAIQFRMHEESGLRPQEIVGFWHEVFGLIKEARPDLRLDLRAKGLPDAVIEDALNQGLSARVSTKFWMEQMGLPFHPTHINPPDQKNRRHSYADLLRYPQRYRVHWQLWSGGTTRLLLWGDPEYVRRFAGAARLYDGDSFEINEMLATKMLGEPHDEPPIGILNPRYRYYDYEFERYWHFYQLWGRLTYDPNTRADLWQREFEKRFGAGAGPHVMNAEHLASGILPRIVASSYRYANFPTTRGWAEMMRQGDLPSFSALEGSDTAQFVSPREAAQNAVRGTGSAGRTPTETSRWFAARADAVDAEVQRAAKTAGPAAGNEFLSTLTDLKILSGLARYYAWRLEAAVSYDVYKETNAAAPFDAAIEQEKHAVHAWRAIVAAAGDVYSDKLPFGAPGIFPRHWSEEQRRLDADLEKLLDARQKAPVSNAYVPPAREPAGPAPTVTLPSPETAAPGRDETILANVSSAAAVKAVRLRYRHLTQFEDYRTLDMVRDPATASYVARIPASFIDPAWDLMYYVEVIDHDGHGRLYPDLDIETPYVIVPVKR
jgi:hypothetical protein